MKDDSTHHCLLKHVEKQEIEALNFGFYWESFNQLIEQIQSECIEIQEAWKKNNRVNLQEEVGDLMQAAIGLAVFCKMDPRTTLLESIQKFQRRYDAVVHMAQRDGHASLHKQPFEVLMSYWNRAKLQSKNPPGIKIITERLIIRQFIESDIEDLVEIYSNPLVMQFSVRGPRTIEQAREQLRDMDITHYENDDYGKWALIHKEKNELIGYGGLRFKEVEGEKKVQISYRLHPDYWKKGFATEAVRGILNYAFSTLKLKELIAIIDPRNEGSIKVAEKIGMRYIKNYDYYGRSVGIYQLDARAWLDR